MGRDELLGLLEEFVLRIRATGDPSPAWSPGVIAMADSLAESLDEEERLDIPARHLLGWLKWYQAEAVPSGQRQALVDEAWDLLSAASIAFGLVDFPEPLLPALADQASLRLPAMLNHAMLGPDTQLLSDLVDQWIHVVNATPRGHPHRARRLAITCGALVSRSQRTDAPADLDQALAVGAAAVQLGADEKDLSMYLSNLGAALKLRYERTHDAADLDEAIAVARRAVAVAAGDSKVAVAATNLSGVLSLRFTRESRPEDAAEAARAARQAVAAADPRDPSLAAILHNLARALYASFELTRSPADLDEALGAARRAVLAGEGHADAAMYLSNLADVLRGRFELTESEADLDEAIMVSRRLVDIRPVEHDSRVHDHLRLAAFLSARFARTGDPADIDDLVAVNRQAVHAVPGSVPLLTSLSTALRFRHEASGKAADLIEAIDLARRAVAISAVGDRAHLSALLQLDRALWAGFQLSRASRDLDEVIVVRRSITEATAADSADLSERLSQLAQALFNRFHDRETPADLDDAISVLRRALAAAATDAERMSCQSDLSCALQSRFEYVGGARSDLDEAADIARRFTVTAQPEPAPGLLISMAIVLDARARRVGTVDDLDAAITLVQRAAAATASEPRPRANRPRGHLQLRATEIWTAPEDDDEPGQTEVRRLLGAYLTRRFEWNYVQADVDAIVASRRETAATTCADGTEHARNLASLSYALKLQYHRTGNRADLDEAVTTCRQALALDPENAVCLTSLSDTLKHRFLADRNDADLEEAIELGRRATQIASGGDGHRAQAFGNLCQVLETRFELHPYTTDIDEAVDAARQALQAAATDFSRPNWLLVLGEVLLTRITHRRGSDADGEASREEDRAEALRVLSELVRSPAAAPRLRVHGAKVGAHLAAATPATPGPKDLALASDLLETAVQLLPEVAPRRMRRAEQQGAIESARGLADDAAAMSLAEPTRPPAERARRALSLLEAGRAVLLGQLLDTRGDLTGLQETHPRLAARFTALRDVLDRDADPALPGDGDRIGAAAELAATLREIRCLDGFATFALPPTAAELLSVADRGPVVSFNVAYRGDALLLTREGVTSLHLPAVTASTVIDQVNAFHVALREAQDPAADRVAAQNTIITVLKWLWDNITGPVLDKLGYHGPPADGTPWPRLWWAPGGFLSLLPLHAAGHHDDPMSGHTVMDRVVSSYTPTIRALRHARLRQTAVGTSANTSLIVAMPTTPGLPDLRNVPYETELLADILPVPLVLTEPDRDRVLTDLPGRAVAHFACHGSYDIDDPTASRLLLHDHEQNPLTVADLNAVNLDGAQLAYLSACHTALNPAERLLGEGMHLAGGLQAAGFPQVVGTLWEVDDEVAVEITDDFYTGLRDTRTGKLDLGRAARSLHRAVRSQRDNYPGTPSLWASHLHFGA
ncbi:CHAT domain-containing protein [Streptomyces sp. NPDC088733]|uniref:CHAT domain-containing protein n=1 Tax=Streptomyces sp. NPDC088733 TaxID=3365880 RepID=UPI00381F160E